MRRALPAVMLVIFINIVVRATGGDVAPPVMSSTSPSGTTGVVTTVSRGAPSTTTWSESTEAEGPP